MHFTTKDDMSVSVPAAGVFTAERRIGNILGWDYKADRILNWDIAEDRLKLEKASVYQQLYNPRPFGVGGVKTQEGDIGPATETEDGAARPPPAKRRRGLSLAALGRTSGADDYDPRTHPAPEGTASALRIEALLWQTRKLLDSLQKRKKFMALGEDV